MWDGYTLPSMNSSMYPFYDETQYMPKFGGYCDEEGTYSSELNIAQIQCSKFRTLFPDYYYAILYLERERMHDSIRGLGEGDASLHN